MMSYAFVTLWSLLKQDDILEVNAPAFVAISKSEEHVSPLSHFKVICLHRTVIYLNARDPALGTSYTLWCQVMPMKKAVKPRSAGHQSMAGTEIWHDKMAIAATAAGSLVLPTLSFAFSRPRMWSRIALICRDTVRESLQ